MTNEIYYAIMMSQKRETFRHDEQTGRSERKREDRPEGNRKTFRGCEAAPEAFRAIRFPGTAKDSAIRGNPPQTDADRKRVDL